jgi:hypothetical protein
MAATPSPVTRLTPLFNIRIFNGIVISSSMSGMTCGSPQPEISTDDNRTLGGSRQHLRCKFQDVNLQAPTMQSFSNFQTSPSSTNDGRAFCIVVRDPLLDLVAVWNGS